jgi:hypothetical protein
MTKRRKKKKDPNKLSEENEFLKLKMMAEFGGNFVGTDKIPAELENQFLKQIINFHKLQDKSETTTIYKYIGEPPYNHVHDLSDQQVKRELKKIQKLLLKNGIKLDVLAETPEREIYRFITEELFKQEIADIKMKGWVNQFIYEDFHPNSEYDVKYAAHHILIGLFDSHGSIYEDFIADQFRDSLGLTTDIEELNNKIQALHSKYNDVILADYDFIETNINSEKGTARLLCDVTFKTQKEKGKRTARHVTTVEMFFRRDALVKNIWQLTRLISEYF